MSKRDFITDSLKASEQRVNAVLNPDAQTNTLCVNGIASDSLNNKFDSSISKLKELDYAVYIVASLQYQYGLRVSEVLNISTSDLISGKRIMIKGLKGSDNRLINVSEYWSFFYNKRLFSGGVFADVNRFYVYRLYKKVGLCFSSVNSTKQSITHSLRHQYVKDLRNSGLSNEIIGNAIGHKNKNNTEKYGHCK